MIDSMKNLTKVAVRWLFFQNDVADKVLTCMQLRVVNVHYLYDGTVQRHSE